MDLFSPAPSSLPLLGLGARVTDVNRLLLFFFLFLLPPLSLFLSTSSLRVLLSLFLPTTSTEASMDESGEEGRRMRMSRRRGEERGRSSTGHTAFNRGRE